MKYKLLGNTGVRVSELCLGTMTFGDDWGWGAPKEICETLVNTFLDAGGNYIDTANYYTNGSSEKILGEILKGKREQIVLSSKYSLLTDKTNINSGGNHRKNMVQSVEQSLRNLQTDYLDMYWVHIWDEETPIEETMRGLEDLVRAGKILYTGISDTPAWLISKANAIANERNWVRFNALQAEYNLVERTTERDLIPMAKHEQMSVLSWSPLAGGLLSGKYNSKNNKAVEGSRLEKSKRLTNKNLAIADVVIKIAEELNVSPPSVALAWIKRNQNIIPIVGARKVEQLQDNLKCIDVVLSKEHLSLLHLVSKIELGFPHDFIKNTKEMVTGKFKLA